MHDRSLRKTHVGRSLTTEDEGVVVYQDDTLEGMAQWAAKLGFAGVQIPTWDARLFDLKKAAESQTYCDEILGTVRGAGPRTPAARRCRWFGPKQGR